MHHDAHQPAKALAIQYLDTSSPVSFDDAQLQAPQFPCKLAPALYYFIEIRRQLRAAFPRLPEPAIDACPYDAQVPFGLKPETWEKLIHSINEDPVDSDYSAKVEQLYLLSTRSCWSLLMHAAPHLNAEAAKEMLTSLERTVSKVARKARQEIEVTFRPIFETYWRISNFKPVFPSDPSPASHSESPVDSSSPKNTDELTDVAHYVMLRHNDTMKQSVQRLFANMFDAYERQAQELLILDFELHARLHLARSDTRERVTQLLPYRSIHGTFSSENELGLRLIRLSFLSTSAVVDRYSPDLFGEQVAVLEYLLGEDLGAFPSSIPTVSCPRKASDDISEQSLTRCTETLSPSARSLFDELQNHPEFSVALWLYQSQPQVIREAVRSYHSIVGCFDRQEARRIADFFVSLELLRPLLHYALRPSSPESESRTALPNILAHAPLLRQSPEVWGIFCSLWDRGFDNSWVSSRGNLCSALVSGDATAFATKTDRLFRLLSRYAFILCSNNTFERSPDHLEGLKRELFDGKLIDERRTQLEHFRAALKLSTDIRSEPASTIPLNQRFSASFLLLLATYPRHTEQALQALAQLNHVFQFTTVPTPYFSSCEIAANAVLTWLEDAIDKTSSDSFSLEHTRLNLLLESGYKSVTWKELIQYPVASYDEAPRAGDALRNWHVRAIGSLMNWREFKDSFFALGYSRQDYLKFRHSLEPLIQIPGSGFVLVGVQQWSAAAPKLPFHTDDLIGAFRELFAPLGTKEFAYRDYEDFSRVLQKTSNNHWIRETTATQLARLFATAAEAYVQRDRVIATLIELVNATTHCAEPLGNDVRFQEVSTRKSAALLHKLQGAKAVELTQAPSLITIHSAFDVLLSAAVLGYRYRGKDESLSLVALQKTYESDLKAEQVSPLHRCWASAQFDLQRLKPLGEQLLSDDVVDIVQRRYQEIRIFFGPHSKPELQKLLALPQGVLYTELESRLQSGYAEGSGRTNYMHAIERYRSSFYERLLPGDTRQFFLRFIEFATENINGGLKDDILCTRDVAFQQALTQAFELEKLILALQQEFELHEHGDNLRDNAITLGFIPTRGVLTEFVGDLCDTCLTRMRNLAKNFPEMVFVPFVRNPEASGKRDLYPRFAGGSLVFEAFTESGEKMLLIRGFNPSNSLLKQVRAGDLFETFVGYLQTIALRLEVKLIGVPEEDWWGLAFSNRPYPFLHVRTKYASAERIRLQDSPVTSFNSIEFERAIVVRDLRGQ